MEKPDRNQRARAATDTAREMLQSAADSGAAPHVKGDLASPSVPAPAPAAQPAAEAKPARPPRLSKTPDPPATPAAEAPKPDEKPDEFDFPKAYEALDPRIRTEIDKRYEGAQLAARDAGMKFLSDKWTELYGWATPLLEEAKDDKN